MTLKEYFENGGEKLELTEEMRKAFQDFIDYLKQEDQKPASK